MPLFIDLKRGVALLNHQSLFEVVNFLLEVSDTVLDFGTELAIASLHLVDSILDHILYFFNLAGKGKRVL